MKKHGPRLKTIRKVVDAFNYYKKSGCTLSADELSKKFSISKTHFYSAIELKYLIKIGFGRYDANYNEFEPIMARRVIEFSNTYTNQSNDSKTDNEYISVENSETSYKFYLLLDDDEFKNTVVQYLKTNLYEISSDEVFEYLIQFVLSCENKGDYNRTLAQYKIHFRNYIYSILTKKTGNNNNNNDAFYRAMLLERQDVLEQRIQRLEGLIFGEVDNAGNFKGGWDVLINKLSKTINLLTERPYDTPF